MDDVANGVKGNPVAVACGAGKGGNGRGGGGGRGDVVVVEAPKLPTDAEEKDGAPAVVTPASAGWPLLLLLF